MTEDDARNNRGEGKEVENMYVKKSIEYIIITDEHSSDTNEYVDVVRKRRFTYHLLNKNFKKQIQKFWLAQ